MNIGKIELTTWAKRGLFWCDLRFNAEF